MSHFNKRNQTSPNYGGARRGTAQKGILSMVITGLAFVILLVLLGISAILGGKAAPVIGMAAIFDIAVSLVGIWVGIQSFHEVDKSYTVSKISISIGILTILCYLFLYYIGMK